MKKLLVVTVVLATLLLGGCVAPGFNMSGSIGMGPQGYGMNRGGYVNQPYYNPNYGNPYLSRGTGGAIAERAIINGNQRVIMRHNKTHYENMMRGGWPR